MFEGIKWDPQSIERITEIAFVVGLIEPIC